MAIEVTVLKDIQEYKEKIIFNMSLRQLLCSFIAVVLSIGTGLLFTFVFHWHISHTSYIIILLNIPVFYIGWFTKGNLNAETYFKIVRNWYLQKSIRLYQTTSLEINKKKEKRIEYVE
ncbi:PrgI family protein [Carnobacteriaceae bacterium zg-ZUI78]|nr:PrgI family protein [Carnobacteriaceae bacterium zg-ZUI78]